MELPTSDFHTQSIESFNTSDLLTNAARQRDARNYAAFPIVDVDCHHYENESIKEIVEYFDDPVIKQMGKLYTSGGTGGQTPFSAGGVGYQDVAGRVTRYPLRKTETTPGDGAHRDVHLSLRWMDAMGVDYVCLFPTPMLSMGLHPQAEVEAAMAKGYNRWLLDKITSREERIKTMIYVPFNDPDAAYEVVKEFGDHPDVIGFMVVSVRYNAVHNNAYMKTYSLMEEIGKPLGFHSNYNWNDRLVGNSNRFLVTHALGFTIYNAVHLCNWIINGLPERFPKLKTIWIESGLAWVPWIMQRLDNDYKMRSSEAPSLKKLPSEYMRDMYFTSQPMEIPDRMGALEMTFDMIDADNQLLWASDYPHWDMDVPSVIYDLPFLDEKQKRKMLGGNAIELFGLDVSKRFPDYKPA
ncbi:MAG: amidohydrolase [Rhodospirillaceae bacterium]|jgi:uncharacterized protein|nr:amidohydrolase [Rhodospirillaceae bacterium]MBT5457637.1 amidohydrolase [Rhodospirillaceae bacterium]